MSQNQPHVLLVDGGQPLPTGVQALLRQGRCRYTTVRGVDDIHDQALLEQVDAALVTGHEPQPRGSFAHWNRWFETLASKQIGVVMMDPAGVRGLDAGTCVLVEPAAPAASADELWGRLHTLIHARQTFQSLERELSGMQVLGKRLKRHIAELDQEMRLASRLQHDLLPPEHHSLDQARFASIYRPAGWISGDLYDIQRVDAEHVAFWVADAVGHGVAAGLLTMFIRQSLEARAVPGDNGELLAPGETLARLNEALARQPLADSQFVTAGYCLLNTRTFELAVARAGHPYPILLAADGTLTELKPSGVLLGIFPGEEFGTLRMRMRPGEKVLLYTDGMECALADHRDGQTGQPRHLELFRALAELGADQFVAHVTKLLDEQEGSLNPRDDLSLVVMEIVPQGATGSS